MTGERIVESGIRRGRARFKCQEMAMRIRENSNSTCTTVIAIAITLAVGLIRIPTASAASDLKLAPDLSFTDDSSSNFPIMNDEARDAVIATDRPTVVFFGTSHCWNTNREAERVVALYPQYRDRVHFVIVDLNHVAPAQHALVSKYYGGHIPTVTIFDRHGKLIYDRAGETAGRRGETLNLAALIDSALIDGAVDTPSHKNAREE
jgi:hypothetical protein